MLQWLVEITSADVELLSFLVKSQQGTLCTFLEEEGRYYLSCSEFDALTIIGEVEQRADGLLSILKGFIKHEFHTNGELTRTGEIICINDQGHRITKTTSCIPVRFRLRIDFFENDKAQSLPFIKRQLIARNAPMVSEAMRYYANETNWFNLYKVYEVIKKDAETKGVTLKLLTKDNTEKFKYSANNANASGDTARHSLAEFPNKAKLTPLSLGDAQKYIDELLTEWLEAK